MSRSDVHSLKNLNPADYIYSGDADFHHEDGWYYVPEEIEEHPLYDSDGDGFQPFHGAFVESRRCDVCGTGAPIRYATFFLHVPTGEEIVVGHLCAKKVGLESRADLEKLRDAKKKAERDRLRRLSDEFRAKSVENRFVAEWIDQYFEIREILEAEVCSYDYEDDTRYEVQRSGYAKINAGEFRANEFIASIASKFVKYGTLSEKQVEAASKYIQRQIENAQKREEDRESLKPVVAGSGIEIVGTVVSVKWQENDFGGRLVMTVRDDRDFLVWGSVPSALTCTEDQAGDAKTGDRVSFVANVEASDRDESFGFFKRPRKAELLAKASV